MMTDLQGGTGDPPIEIAVFWDYENTPLPREVRPAEAAKSIQAAAESLPSVAGRLCRINMRRVYYDPEKVRGVPRDPSGLDSSGFDLASQHPDAQHEGDGRQEVDCRSVDLCMGGTGAWWSALRRFDYRRWGLFLHAVQVE
mmetsp:Transcript_17893/g.51277  ORF Transcript_17893/g.51277 Transcript_17893/m.51277 type:complete len:141 (+) Transcript_17893:4-426(+)